MWSGVTKFLRSQLAQRRVVETKLLGQFAPGVSEHPLEHHRYQPAASLAAKFALRQGESNVPPEKKLDGASHVKLSLTSLAMACKSSRAAVKDALAAIDRAICELTRSGAQLRLDLRVGWLSVGGKKAEIYFENYSLAAPKPRPLGDDPLSDISAATPATRADTASASLDQPRFRHHSQLYKRLDAGGAGSKPPGGEAGRFNEIEVRLPHERREVVVKSPADSKQREDFLQSMRNNVSSS